MNPGQVIFGFFVLLAATLNFGFFVGVGIVQRRGYLIRRSAWTLLVGFAAAMVITVLTTWLLTAAGLVDRSMLLAERPLTAFIWRPDALSWVIGFLAGIAGMLSLTSAKTGTLVGVLISVTTVPAVANAAVAVAQRRPRSGRIRYCSASTSPPSSSPAYSHS
jgi:uncharacterized hydrophobic protein (TIGR00271 family)